MDLEQKIIKYDLSLFPFAEIVKKFLNVESLELLHKKYQFTDEIKAIGSDTHTEAHKAFYKNLNNNNLNINTLYYQFIEKVLFKEFDENIIFQKQPGFRIQSPNNVAVSTWHGDGDELHQHPNGEINIFLPLTRTFGNNSVWTESRPGLKDYHPVKLDLGECLIFNGHECVHGNYVNDTHITRISFDFRVMKRQDYDPTYKVKTATMGHSYIIGEYYLDKDSLNYQNK